MEKSSLKPFLREYLDILFVGLNPAKGSSDKRHYFSVNQALWNQLYNSGLLSDKVIKDEADDLVFGSNDINFNNWSYGITDLITEVAESNSNLVSVDRENCRILIEVIIETKPRVVILLHQKVVKNVMKYLGFSVPKANVGELGRLIEDCDTMFYAIGFPRGNTILSKDKVLNYKKVKEYLLS